MEKLAINGGSPVRSAPFQAWPIYDERDEEALVGALRSGYWGLMGANVPELEAKFAELHSVKHAICVSSGTMGLVAAMKAVGVGRGDEVIIPSYTFIATASAVVETGAVPVFVDVDAGTGCMDAESAKGAITERTKAIIPVHVAGQPADMDAILKVAESNRLMVIEDAAQAHGAEWNGAKVGGIGLAGTFSFQSSKNLASGEGGMVATMSDEMAYCAFAYLNSGRAHKDDPAPVAVMGQNYRMTEFQAALLLSQLGKFPQQFKKRDENARYLSELLRQIEGVTPPAVHPKVTAHAWHLYMIGFESEKLGGVEASRVLDALCAEGIPLRRGYSPLYENPVFADGGVDSVKMPCPVCEDMAARTLWLTQSPLLGTRQDMEDIAAGIEKVMSNLEQLR